MSDPLIAGLNRAMDVYERKERVELEAMITHPVGEYTDEKVSRLVEQMAQAQRWTHHPDMKFNV